jgi:hypothetical protein
MSGKKRHPLYPSVFRLVVILLCAAFCLAVEITIPTAYMHARCNCPEWMASESIDIAAIVFALLSLAGFIACMFTGILWIMDRGIYK